MEGKQDRGGDNNFWDPEYPAYMKRRPEGLKMNKEGSKHTYYSRRRRKGNRSMYNIPR